MPTITVTIPYLAEMSVNRAYRRRRGGGVYLDRTAAQGKMLLRAGVLRALDEHNLTPPQGGERVEIFLDMRYPKQRGRHPDPSNFLKTAQDAIAEAFGIDDVSFFASARSAAEAAGRGELRYEVRW